MPVYNFNVSFNGGALEDGGILVLGNSLFLSPIAVTTFGFIYEVSDIWFNLDDTICQDVTWTSVSTPSTTWTPCSCSASCG